MKPYGNLRYPYGGIGNLSCNRAGGESASGYEYGHPAGGSSESNVSLQFIFDEASGDIVDEVASVTLADFTNGSAITYEVDSSGYSSSMAKSIKCPANAGGTNGGGFFKDSSTPEAALGTSDSVLEFVAAFDSGHTGSFQYIITTMTTGSQNGFYVFENPNSGGRIFLELDNGGTATGPIWVVGDLRDDVMRKFRITMDRDGNAELFINEVSQGTADISSMSAESVPASGVRLALWRDNVTSNQANITLNELRLTVGNLVNNSGGPDDN